MPRRSRVTTTTRADLTLLAKIREDVESLPDSAVAAIAKYALSELGLEEDPIMSDLDAITDADPNLQE